MSDTHMTATDIVAITRDLATIIALIAGAYWAIFVLKDPQKSILEIESLGHEVELLRAEVNQEGLEMDMDIQVAGSPSTNGTYLFVYVVIENTGPDSFEIVPSRGPLSIRRIENTGTRPGPVATLSMVEYGREIAIIDRLVIGPNDRQQVSFVYGVEKSGAYIVIFEIPVSRMRHESETDKVDRHDPGLWSVQKFVLVP